MSACEERDQFLAEWQEAVVSFSDAVKRLRQCNGDVDRFADQYDATEAARLLTEKVRKTLEHHRADHGC
jgi:hypothetical protein